MKTFIKQLDDLREQAIEKLQDLIYNHWVKSDHNGRMTLKITKEDCQYNLDGGRYLTEINTDCLVDNNGYEYGYDAIEIEKFLAVIDYLTQKYRYKKK